MNYAEIIEDIRFDLFATTIGIRAQDEEFPAVGEEIDHVSHIWEDGEDLGEELDGLCAIMINNYAKDNEIYKAIKYCDKMYKGKHLAVVYSEDCCEMGEDEDEVILTNPKVGYVIR